MRIIRLASGVEKTAGRKIKIMIFGSPRGKKLYPLPDQGLGESCKQITDKLNPGAAVAQQSWTDRPRPDDIREEELAQNISM